MKKFLSFISEWSTENARFQGEYYTKFAAFGIVYFMIPYYFWPSDTDHNLLTLILRSLACLLCFYLVVYHQTKISKAKISLSHYCRENLHLKPLSKEDEDNFYLSQIHSGYLPLFWYFTLFYCLPLMSTYNMLIGNFETKWIATSSLSMITLVLVVDWRSFIILNIAGIMCGLVLYIIEAGFNFEYKDVNYFLVAYVHFFSIIIGAFLLQQKETMIQKIRSASDELSRFNENLDSLVKQRIEEIKKELDNKTEFLNNISHELRTPLQGIVGISSTLHSEWGRYEDKEKEYQIGIIFDSSKRLITLLNNLLDVSKFQAGKMIFNFKNHNLVTAIESAKAELIPFLESKNSKVKFQRPENLSDFEFSFDNERIIQVVRNFISNAAKYSSEDIEVSLQFCDINNAPSEIEKSTSVVVKVKDYGIGIPESEIKNIFLPFARTSRTDNNVSGSGLGLSLCSEIINAHKGKIWAYNNKGEKGATFCFALPIDTSLILKKNSNQPVKPKKESTKQHKVLFVDDEKFCQISAKVILESSGFNVVIAECGKDAVRLAMEDKYDIILLDLMMPDMYGTEVLKNIRKNSLNETTPIILQSGAYDENEITHALTLGITDYIIKPYNKEEVLEKIYKLITN